MIHLLVKGKETCHGLWCNFFCSSWTPSEKSWSICAATSFNLCPFSSWWRRARHSSIQSMTERIPLVSSSVIHIHIVASHICIHQNLCFAVTPHDPGVVRCMRKTKGIVRPSPTLQAFQRKVPSQAIASRGGVSTCFPSDFLPDSAVFAPRKAEKRESKVWATPWTRGCWLFTLWKCRALVQKVTMLVRAHHVHSCIPYGLDTNAHGVQSPTVWPFEHQCSWWYPWTSEAHSDQKRSGSLIE